MKVIVVGAGVLGASVARSLAVSGEEVLLLDRTGPGAGTSSTTFAWTNSNRKPDPDYYRLNLAGMAEHEKLARELPGEPAYFRSGGVQFAAAESEPELVENVERLQGLGYPTRWVTRAEAAAIARGIRIPDDTTAIAHFPTEGYVRPDRLVQNLLADAVRHGAVLSIGEVLSTSEGPDRASVTLADATVHTADRVVLAAGRWTDDLAARSGLDIPMITDTGRGSPIIGLLGYVRSPALDIGCVVHTPKLNLRPGAGAPTVVQALDLNPEVDPSRPPAPGSEIATEMTRRLTALLADPGQAPEIDFRVGFRALPADGNTIAGYPGEHARTYCLASHGGITLAPLLGRLVATEILTGESQELLKPFRPSRFAGVRRSDLPAVSRPVKLGEQ
ncbi:Glycine/D-amino acid oxidase [Saccharopolyspora kobensis]|uniref:Glycine/D-amino acid oxidase n=1 Tax=Saccharopolyspora kobensis TaxID=146035 RepID=A0A1H6CBC2_9PSEU|nr:FAD-binding oxidoreductase [Saccharopolyspora kobensis]SEG70087.1 Glycine/D-amino acid oxidase [Saccharopolyspora kobensis]SFC34100.1 Glycine/D-amino acid oxidase [Saccharopolyspora kobensis]